MAEANSGAFKQNQADGRGLVTPSGHHNSRTALVEASLNLHTGGRQGDLCLHQLIERQALHTPNQAAVAFEAGKPLQIEMVDLEGPKAGEVLVEIKATGICPEYPSCR